MLKLLVNSQEASQSPNVTMRWCLDRSDLERLQRDRGRIDDVFVLLVVQYQDWKYCEDRQLVPLTEYETIIGFRYPGKHTVRARLIFSEPSRDEELKIKNWFLTRYRPGHYRNDVFTYASDEFKDLWMGCTELSVSITDYAPADEVDVDVDTAHFPKRPPKWLWRWGNLWFESPAIDQCQFRRRFLICAGHIQLAVVPVYLIGRFLSQLVFLAFFGFLGYRGLHPSVLFHPWKRSYKDVYTPKEQEKWPYKRIHSSWFAEDANGRKRTLRFILNPVTLTLVFAAIHVASWWLGASYPEVIYRFATTVGGALLAFVLLLPLFFMLIIGMIRGAGTVDSTTFTVSIVLAGIVMGSFAYLLLQKPKEENKAKRAEEKAKRRREREAAKKQTEQAVRDAVFKQALDLLACPVVVQTPNPARVAAIPKERRSIRLRYLATKAKVCRPYAGN